MYLMSGLTPGTPAVRVSSPKASRCTSLGHVDGPHTTPPFKSRHSDAQPGISHILPHTHGGFFFLCCAFPPVRNVVRHNARTVSSRLPEWRRHVPPSAVNTAKHRVVPTTYMKVRSDSLLGSALKKRNQIPSSDLVPLF